MPAICYKEGTTNKALPELEWGGGKGPIPPLLGGYNASLVQAACLVCEESVQLSVPFNFCGSKE